MTGLPTLTGYLFMGSVKAGNSDFGAEPRECTFNQTCFNSQFPKESMILFTHFNLFNNPKGYISKQTKYLKAYITFKFLI